VIWALRIAASLSLFSALIGRCRAGEKPFHSFGCQPVALVPALPERSPVMTTCVYVQIRCKPGTTYKVAEDIALREIHSELYSTSGEYDLLMKLYIPEGKDVGKYINEELLGITGIERSLTTMTFKAF
jgi:DNA-binding Lrp family transcriptional regulator